MPREDPGNADAAAKLAFDEESQWVAVEDRRRRRVAFEETVGDTLRYLENSEDLKVSVTELLEQLGMSEEAGISIKDVAQQARNENGHNFLKFQVRRRRAMHCQLGQMESAVKRSGGVGKRSQNKRQEEHYLSERQEIFRGMLEDKIRMQSRATPHANPEISSAQVGSQHRASKKPFKRPAPGLTGTDLQHQAKETRACTKLRHR